jgi:hypothetical protein
LHCEHPVQDGWNDTLIAHTPPTGSLSPPHVLLIGNSTALLWLTLTPEGTGPVFETMM